jgi:hypothetical protein
MEVSTSLALAEVNVCLRKQGRTELRVTEGALLQQLREGDRLLGADGGPLTAGDEPTRRVWLEGRRLRAFTVSRRELLGEG